MEIIVTIILLIIFALTEWELFSISMLLLALFFLCLAL